VNFAVFQSLGPTELIIVLAIVLLIFGPKRLPGLGKQLGSGMREFRDSITNRHGSDDDVDDAEATSEATADKTREQANAALGRPEDTPTEGEVVSERTR
jgi:sec-independent protein translocase protein TatA